MGRPSSCCNLPCGWSTPTGAIDTSTTVSGTMTLTYGTFFGSTVLQSNGTGEAIITMTGNFTAGQNTFTVTSPSYASSLPTSGVFWFGICNGVGFQYDFSTHLVSRIILNDDGSVRSTSTAASYVPATDFTGAPIVFMAWCPSIDCDRLIIGGTRNVAGAPWSAATLMDLVEQPFGKVKIAFGTTISATGGFANTRWTLSANCTSTVCPCVPVPAMAAMVTPTKASAGWSGSLSFNPGAPPGTVGLTQTNPFANLTPNAGKMTSPLMIDPNGFDYCYQCGWNGSYPQTNVTASSGTCVLPMPTANVPHESIGASLLIPQTSFNTPASLGYCIDLAGAPLPTKWHVTVQYAWQQQDAGPGTIISYTVLVVYEGAMNANFTAATFSLLTIGHIYVDSRTTLTCASTCNVYNWIDPASWPASITLTWVASTAPTCVTSGSSGGGVCGSIVWTAVASGGPLGGVAGAALIWQQTSGSCTGACLPAEPAFYPPSLGATTTTFCS